MGLATPRDFRVQGKYVEQLVEICQQRPKPGPTHQAKTISPRGDGATGRKVVGDPARQHREFAVSVRELALEPSSQSAKLIGMLLCLADQVDRVPSRRRQLRVDAALEAHFPARRTLEDFDFSFQPAIDPTVIADLAALDFLEAGAPILLLGKPGAARATWPSL